MKLIDLVLFAEHSQKIPDTFLTPQLSSKEKSWEVLGIHLIDFFTAFSITFVMTAILTESVQMILVTQGLQKAFKAAEAMNFTGRLFPLVLFSYFFFSYFMNHGQTVGMHFLKKRIKMRSQSFRDAFSWALHSFAMCFSCGISYLIKSENWSAIKEHDYLYEHLMESKVDYSIDLLARTEEHEKDQNEEIYLTEAA